MASLISAALLVTLIPAAAQAVAPQPDAVVDLAARPIQCQGTPGSPGIAQGVPVDCVVPIATEMTDNLPQLSVVGTGYSEALTCEIRLDGVPNVTSEPAYLCRDIPTPGSAGSGDLTVSTTVELLLDGIPLGGVAATITWRDTADYLWQHQRLDGQAVVGDRPLVVRDFANNAANSLFLRVRPRNGDDVVTEVASSGLVPVAQTGGFGAPGDFSEYQVDLSDTGLAQGLYRFWFCVGLDAGRCTERPGGYAFEVISPAVSPLVAGQNGDPANRINVVFVGSGLDTPEWAASGLTLNDVATDLLGLDGTREVRPVPPPTYRPDTRLAWGPLTIEPFKSHADAFNFWVLDQPVSNFRAFGGTPASVEASDRGLGLPHVAIVAVGGSPTQIDGSRAFLGGGTDVGTIDELIFGTANISVSPYLKTFTGFDDGPTILSHELGHTLFGLVDEYEGPGPKPADALSLDYNCAVDAATGAQKWAAFLGQTDPFAADVVTELNAAGIDTTGYNPTELSRIRVVTGGCTDTLDGLTARPSTESIMGHNLPVFGALNRARAQEVLSRFGGTTSTSEPTPGPTATTPTPATGRPSGEATPTRGSSATSPASAETTSASPVESTTSAVATNHRSAALAYTGPAVVGLIALGFVLLVGGSLLVIFGRRKNRSGARP